MTAFTISTANGGSKRITELTGKTGGDTYTVQDGHTLTIDCDSRYGLNQNTSATMGNITISTTSGGKVLIDGRYVRLIPFDTGSGNVPAAGTVISQGAVTGKLIGVWTAINVAPTAAGSAMPTSGFIKVNEVSQIPGYSAGALTGIGANATGADVAGWIDVVGDDAGTATVPRLGSFEVQGEWFEVGTTSGVANQTMQLPNNGTLLYVSGVYVEKSVGANEFEFWPNMGTNTDIGTDEFRGKVVWINNTGLVRFGHNGTSVSGYTPVSGLRVVTPNVFLQCALTTARTINKIPHASIATRYDFTTTAGGAILMNKCSAAWYLSFTSAYSLTLVDVAAIDTVLLSKIATPVVFTRVGVAEKADVSLTGTPFSCTLCPEGGTVTEGVFSKRTSLAINCQTSANWSFINCTARVNYLNGGATAAFNLGANTSSVSGLKLITGHLALFANDIMATGIEFAGVPTGITTTTIYSYYVVTFASAANNVVVDGITLAVAGTHPYGPSSSSGILQISNAPTNVILQNVGTPDEPFNGGASANTPYIVISGSGASPENIKIRRCYAINIASGIYSGLNSIKGVTEENVWAEYSDTADVVACLNTVCKGRRSAGTYTAQTAVYGSHFVDEFISDTQGRITFLMNEQSASTIGQAVPSNGAAFTSAGTLYMPTIGHQIVFETPHYIIGHTGFANTLPVMSGGTLSNYTVSFDIDKNDGNGFSGSYTTATAANLAAVTGIDAEKGFRLRVKIVTSTGNTTAISKLYLTTTCTTTTQRYLYPLDVYTLTFTGLSPGSDVVVREAGTSTILGAVDSASGTSWSYEHQSAQTVDVDIIKPGMVLATFRNLSLPTSNISLPVTQLPDRNYV